MRTESNIKFIVRELYMIITDSISSHVKDMKVQYNRRMGELSQQRDGSDQLDHRVAMDHGW